MVLLLLHAWSRAQKKIMYSIVGLNSKLALSWFIYVRGSVEESKPVPLILVLIKVQRIAIQALTIFLVRSSIFGKPCHLVPAPLDIPAGTTAGVCGSAPELTKTWFSVALELLCPELSNMTEWKVRIGQLNPGSRNAPNPLFWGHPWNSTCTDFNSITRFMFCSIWSEISKLNWNSWCYLGAVAEPFLRGAVLFPCTSMAGQGRGWWGNICGASCITTGSAYSSR